MLRIPWGKDSGKQKYPALRGYSFNSFTIRTIPSRITGTLKFRSNPRLRPDNLRYVRSCALWIGSIFSHDFNSSMIAFSTTVSSL
jgi:hypothetical protein